MNCGPPGCCGLPGLLGVSGSCGADIWFLPHPLPERLSPRELGQHRTRSLARSSRRPTPTQSSRAGGPRGFGSGFPTFPRTCFCRTRPELCDSIGSPAATMIRGGPGDDPTTLMVSSPCLVATQPEPGTEKQGNCGGTRLIQPRPLLKDAPPRHVRRWPSTVHCPLSGTSGAGQRTGTPDSAPGSLPFRFFSARSPVSS